MIKISEIDFETILPIWSKFLWPDRKSLIEPQSLIEFGNYPYTYDVKILDYKPIFIGAYCEGALVGVNSGFLTTDLHFRSRGLYVAPEFRGNGIGRILLEHTKKSGRKLGAMWCWSIPRQSSFRTYSSAGFMQYGDFFTTETSDSNCFAYVSLL